MYNAIPNFEDGAEVMFQRGEEMGIAVSFEAMRNDDDVMLRWGRLPDLILP